MERPDEGTHPAEGAAAELPELSSSSSSSSSSSGTVSSFEDGEDNDYSADADAGAASTCTNETRAKSEKKSARRHHHPRDAPLTLDEVFLDWDALMDPRSSAERLNRFLSVLEVDALAGWATHRDRPHRGINSTNHQYNPLFGDGLLPNAPPRPTVVRSLVQDPAKEFCQQSDVPVQRQQQGHVRQRVPKRFRGTSSDAAAQPDAKRTCRLQDRFHHSAAVSIAMLAEEAVTASLLPLAMRHVQRCRALEDAVLVTTENEIKEEGVDLKKKAKTEEDDCAEEEETTLDPQERERLVRMAQQEASEQWTLPPEEAIQNFLLAEPAEETALPVFARAAPPTRTSVAGAPGTTLLNQPRSGVREKQAFVAWCQSQKLDPAVVERTRDFAGYRAFVNKYS